jgi:hypothetical protein
VIQKKSHCKSECYIFSCETITLFVTFVAMNIEEMNRLIMQGSVVKLERNETIRGSINHQLIASLREYWAEHGYPTEKDYIEHIKKIQNANTLEKTA